MPRGSVLLAKVQKNTWSDLALVRRDTAGIGIVLDVQLRAWRPGGGWTPCGTVSATPEVWRKLLPALAQEVSGGTVSGARPSPLTLSSLEEIGG